MKVNVLSVGVCATLLQVACASDVALPNKNRTWPVTNDNGAVYKLDYDELYDDSKNKQQIIDQLHGKIEEPNRCSRSLNKQRLSKMGRGQEPGNGKVVEIGKRKGMTNEFGKGKGGARGKGMVSGTAMGMGTGGPTGGGGKGSPKSSGSMMKSKSGKGREAPNCDLYAVMQGDQDLTYFLSLAKSTEFAREVLQGILLSTVFAPTNAAFNRLNQTLLEQLNQREWILHRRAFLDAHASPRLLFSEDFT